MAYDAPSLTGSGGPQIRLGGDFRLSGFQAYHRCSFKTRLPVARQYAPSHYWMERDPHGLWRVGFTTFATRMIGEAVDCGFDIAPGAPVGRGEVVGWLEGFKALTELYCPMDGVFVGVNPALQASVEPISASPYGGGWLYSVRGDLPDDALDVEGYAALLDDLIDRMARARGVV